jgi:hypothetical protein
MTKAEKKVTLDQIKKYHKARCIMDMSEADELRMEMDEQYPLTHQDILDAIHNE